MRLSEDEELFLRICLTNIVPITWDLRGGGALYGPKQVLHHPWLEQHRVEPDFRLLMQASSTKQCGIFC